MAANTSPHEDVEQKAFIAWLEAHRLRFYAVPNSTFTPYWAQKVKAKAMGQKAGVPDLVVFIPNLGTLYIEMKRVKGGVVSDEQKEWIEFLNTMPCTQAFVAKGADEAIRIVKKFLALAIMKA